MLKKSSQSYYVHLKMVSYRNFDPGRDENIADPQHCHSIIAINTNTFIIL